MNVQTVTLRDAKARLSELTERASTGADSVITKHGRPAARLTAVRSARKPVDPKQLKALVQAMPRQPHGAGRALRELREQSRY